MGGWSETDNRAISVQLNLTGTATVTELGKKVLLRVYGIYLRICLVFTGKCSEWSDGYLEESTTCLSYLDLKMWGCIVM